MMVLVPVPREIEELEGFYTIPDGGFAFLGKGAKRMGRFLKEFLDLELSAFDGKGTVLKMYIDPNQVPWKEGYVLKIEDGITIVGHDEAGLFYGLMTLKQIVRQYGRTVPRLRIKDYPTFPERGVMIDISRDKVPKMETLKLIVDMLSELKINHLELYTEHTFAYREHEKVWKDYSPLTGQEVMELDEYAKERFVELVPNQNSFGHMTKWLVHEEYKHMAEAPNGFVTPWGDRWNIPFSLSPAIPETVDFLDSLYEELLPHFSSEKFNVGCDETFDLCQGKSKDLCEKYGKGRVYLDFLLKIHSLVEKRGKTMLFWGDIIKNHPELVGELPDGVVALIWGYEKDHPFDRECALFERSGVPFYVCPGTSTWNSIVGRWNNMVGNIENAIRNGLRHGALGVLNTDWGDNGHWQHLPFSFPGWVFGASLSWNPREFDLVEALNVHVFEDESRIMGSVMKRLGGVYRMLGVETFNATLLALVLIYPDRISREHKYFKDLDVGNVRRAKDEISKALEDLRKANMKRKDADLIVREVENGAELALHSLKLMEELLKTEDGRVGSIPEATREELSKDLDRIVKEYESIWRERNREGGLKFSVEKLTKIMRFYGS